LLDHDDDNCVLNNEDTFNEDSELTSDLVSVIPGHT